MATVNSFGLIIVNIKEIGKMVNSMVEAFTQVQTDRKERVNGLKVKELNGLRNQMILMLTEIENKFYKMVI